MKPVLFLVAVIAVHLGGSSAAVYYVDGRLGNDSNDGLTTTRAFKTIKECVKAVKYPGDECQIRAGRYHEEVNIDKKRGTPEQPIIIRGYNDEIPIIDGTIPLTPRMWRKKDSSGIYEGLLSQDIWQLFVDDVMMTNARWPNALWTDRTVFLNTHWAKATSRIVRGTITDVGTGTKSLAASGLNVKGAMAILNIGSYNTFISNVTSHVAGSRSFQYNHHFDFFKENRHNQYFLEDKLDFLDQEGEWFYNKTTKRLYVKPYGGIAPTNMRGKVQTYAFNITDCKHMVLRQIEFYATTLQAVRSKKRKYIENVTFHSLNFNYPSYSRRMLGSFDPPHWTKIDSRRKSFTLFNCTFFGSDGFVLEYNGANVRVENNLFEYNDWSAANMKRHTGGLGDIFSRGTGDRFVRNTVRYNGASAGYRPYGPNSLTELNLFEGQCWGSIQNDGAAVQVQTGTQLDSVQRRNWVHSSPKFSIRYDGGPPKLGYRGTMRENVVWQTGGMMVKGDNHTVENNLVFERYKERPGLVTTRCSLCVLRYLRENPIPFNSYTVVRRNGADRANGGKHRGRLYPLAGSVVEDNVVGDVRAQVVDADNLDFRPKAGSRYRSLNAGAYPYDARMSHYWIPGRQLYKTSTPVPPSGSNTVSAGRDALMWLNAYGASVHDVYFSRDKPAVANADRMSAEYKGAVRSKGNVFHMTESLERSTQYFWRVDALQRASVVYKGDVWNFTTTAA